MNASQFLASRFDTALQHAATPATSQRLWLGFLTARAMIALALILMEYMSYAVGQSWSILDLVIGGTYLVACLLGRWWLARRLPAPEGGLHWLPSLGVDLVFVSAFLWLNLGSSTPNALLAFPVLMAAALGTQRVSLVVSAFISTMLLAHAVFVHKWSIDSATQLTQAGLMGVVYFFLGFMVNMLARRLTREEAISIKNRATALLQSQINQLVVERLPDGMLVFDEDLNIRTINPVARSLLGLTEHFAMISAQSLPHHTAWAPLLDLVRATFATVQDRQQDIHLNLSEQSSVQLQVRTQLTQIYQPITVRVCVVFLRDLRELQAQLRTEKLAAMGRMSAAIAHEIRNPLAAITQANALLQEDFTDSSAQRLIGMIEHNAQRLSRIVNDVLNVARVEPVGESSPIEIDPLLQVLCEEWLHHPAQAGRGPRQIQKMLNAAQATILFDTEHLRRILVNLLDNAYRYQAQLPDSIQVCTHLSFTGHVTLKVWSDGPALEHSVQKHLFEPFFSSESRSSGLGLYICRQLCEQHQAQISYERDPAPIPSSHQTHPERLGNAFSIRFRSPAQPIAAGSNLDHVII